MSSIEFGLTGPLLQEGPLQKTTARFKQSGEKQRIEVHHEIPNFEPFFLEIRPPKEDCGVVLLDSEDDDVLASCGVIYHPDIFGKEKRTSHFRAPVHCPIELVHSELARKGIMSFLWDVRANVHDILMTETCQSSDLMMFYIRKGYVPVGIVENYDQRYESDNFIPLDTQTTTELIAFLRKNYGKDQDIFHCMIRLQCKPEEAESFYREILEK